MSSQDNIEGKNTRQPEGMGARPSPLLGVGAFATMGLVDLATHLGSPGLLAAVIAGVVAYSAGGDIGQMTKETVNNALADIRPLLPKRFQGSEVVDEEEDDDDPEYERMLAELRKRPVLRPEFVDENEEDEDEDERLLPVAPAFQDMCHLIQIGRMVLCYDLDGPVYGTVQDLLSMIIIGKPGRGKTTALLYYVAILLKYGAEVHVWDPHGSMSDLADISEKLHYTDDFDDAPESMKYLFAELKERRMLYKKDKSVKHPLLFLADELPEIAAYAKSNSNVGKLFELFVLSARKWNCFFIGSGQGTNAQILPTMVTENMSSRAVFFTEDHRARMAGLSNEVCKKFLPALQPDTAVGRMIFDCSRKLPFIGAIPWVTTDDVKAFLGVSKDGPFFGHAETPGNGLETHVQALREEGRNVSETVLETEETVLEDPVERLVSVSNETLKHIKRMKEMHYPDREISKLLGLSGGRYRIYQQALVHLGYSRQERG